MRKVTFRPGDRLPGYSVYSNFKYGRRPTYLVAEEKIFAQASRPLEIVQATKPDGMESDLFAAWLDDRFEIHHQTESLEEAKQELEKVARDLAESGESSGMHEMAAVFVKPRVVATAEDLQAFLEACDQAHLDPATISPDDLIELTEGRLRVSLDLDWALETAPEQEICPVVRRMRQRGFVEAQGWRLARHKPGVGTVMQSDEEARQMAWNRVREARQELILVEGMCGMRHLSEREISGANEEALQAWTRMGRKRLSLMQAFDLAFPPKARC